MNNKCDHNIDSDYVGFYDISIIRLISNPNKYIGKRVFFTGYLRLDFEGEALYLDEESYKNFNYKNAVYLILTNKAVSASLPDIKKAYEGEYVRAEGYVREGEGFMGLFSAEIVLTHIEDLPEDPNNESNSLFEESSK